MNTLKSTPYEITKIKVDIFEEYWIENIDWKIFEFNNHTFLWISWKYKYLFYESLDKNKDLDLKNDWLEEIEKEFKEFLSKKVNIVISHFPVYWIMDRPASISHRWLKILEKYIEINNPEYLFHWHLHSNEEQYYYNTKITQIFMYKIVEL